MNEYLQELKSKDNKTQLESAICKMAYGAANELHALEAENAELWAALARICANPAVQDLIEANPRTKYLISDAREALSKTKGS